MKRARFLVGLTAALLTLTTGQASTFTTLTLVQQAKKAQVIVRATVGTPTTTQTGGVSWINYPLTVTETIAGDVASLPVREGKPTLMFLAGLQDVPALNSGQDVFLLLYTGTQDSPLVGFNQGAYPVINGRVTRWNEAATAAAFGADAPAQTAADTSAANVTAATAANATTNAATASTAAGASATATTPPPAPPVDGATAAVSNPVVPSPTPNTGPNAGTVTSPVAAGTTTPATTAPAATTSAVVNSAATTPAAPASATATTAATVTPTSTATPDPFERDPAKFRDQLRAARNTP
ncbi:hypothetical protein ACFFLM_10680 [Deinococcus oregonensis]|uniref:MPT63-like domain-containing protein n=1 Tax=Deinococcus oregonensis TaxID=1805970 RepID=A0ABV6AY49_9DEIO